MRAQHKTILDTHTHTNIYTQTPYLYISIYISAIHVHEMNHMLRQIHYTLSDQVYYTSYNILDNIHMYIYI